MRRRLFTAASLLSLLLSLAAGIEWVHSRQRWDIAFRDDQRQPADSALWLLAASRGSIWVYHERYDARMRERYGPVLDWGVASRDRDDVPFVLVADPTWLAADHPFRHVWPAWVQSGRTTDGWQMLIIPAWCVIAATLILPVIELTRRIRAVRRRTTGLCAKCGYDLRASKDRCPECGTPAPVIVQS